MKMPVWLRYARQLLRLFQPFAPERLVLGWDQGSPEGDRSVLVGMRGGRVVAMIEGEDIPGYIAGLETEPSAMVGNHARYDDDQFHEMVCNDFNIAIMRGEIDSKSNFEARFRVSWICSKCSKVHFQHGSMVQVMDLFAAFVQMGYPWIRIENAAFVEAWTMDGIDPNDPVAQAEAYRRLLGRDPS